MGWGAHALLCSCCLSGVWQVLSWSIAWRWLVAVVFRWFCCHFLFVSFPAFSISVLAFVVWPAQVFCLFGEPAADATLYAMMAETRPHAALPWLALVHTFAVLSATLWREMLNTYIHTYIHIYIYIYIQTRMHIMSPLEAETFMPTASSPVFSYTCTNLCTYVYLSVYIHLYTYMYIYTHTHTHAHRLPTAEREDMAQLAPHPNPPSPPLQKKKHKRGKSCYETRIAHFVFRRPFHSMLLKSRHAMQVLQNAANNSILRIFLACSTRPSLSTELKHRKRSIATEPAS